MTHPFYVGRDARYTGAATVPRTEARGVPAAALVLHHTRAVPLDPMFRALDAHPAQRGVAYVRLVPVTAFDFYARGHDLPDLRQLGREEHAAGDAQGGTGHVRARAAVGIPAAGADLPEVRGGAARGGDRPACMAGEAQC